MIISFSIRWAENEGVVVELDDVDTETFGSFDVRLRAARPELIPPGFVLKYVFEGVTIPPSAPVSSLKRKTSSGPVIAHAVFPLDERRAELKAMPVEERKKQANYIDSTKDIPVVKLPPTPVVLPDAFKGLNVLAEKLQPQLAPDLGPLIHNCAVTSEALTQNSTSNDGPVSGSIQKLLESQRTITTNAIGRLAKCDTEAAKDLTTIIVETVNEIVAAAVGTEPIDELLNQDQINADNTCGILGSLFAKVDERPHYTPTKEKLYAESELNLDAASENFASQSAKLAEQKRKLEKQDVTASQKKVEKDLGELAARYTEELVCVKKDIERREQNCKDLKLAYEKTRAAMLAEEKLQQKVVADRKAGIDNINVEIQLLTDKSEALQKALAPAIAKLDALREGLATVNGLLEEKIADGSQHDQKLRLLMEKDNATLQAISQVQADSSTSFAIVKKTHQEHCNSRDTQNRRVVGCQLDLLTGRWTLRADNLLDLQKVVKVQSKALNKYKAKLETNISDSEREMIEKCLPIEQKTLENKVLLKEAAEAKLDEVDAQWVAYVEGNVAELGERTDGVLCFRYNGQPEDTVIIHPRFAFNKRVANARLARKAAIFQIVEVKKEKLIKGFEEAQSNVAAVTASEIKALTGC